MPLHRLDQLLGSNIGIDLQDVSLRVLEELGAVTVIPISRWLEELYLLLEQFGIPNIDFVRLHDIGGVCCERTLLELVYVW